MAQKPLREFLQEDQEPFQLKLYIADRRFQIPPRPFPTTDLQVKKRKPISRNPTLPSKLCDTSCFFSGRSTPDPRKSPLFELTSRGNRRNRVFLQVPARTAAILLEAAARIQKQSLKNAKSKARNRRNAFGLFGSVVKRLSNRKPETQLSEVKLRFQDTDGKQSSFSTCTAAVFSEREWHSDSEPLSSSRRCGDNFEFFDGFGCRNADADDSSVSNSPFRFVLQTTPSSSVDQTPHFTSPATSPTHRITEDEDSYETKTLEKLREPEQEEDKEQCSPVSVLDHPDDEDNDYDGDDGDDLHDLDLQCSFEVVQRAKRRLLRKLRRFEQLAGLDAMDLERTLTGQESEDETLTFYDSEEDLDEDLERMEEEAVLRDEDQKKDRQRERWRMMKSWKGLRSEGINEIVKRELREEMGGEEVQEAASEVELYIFYFLVEEISLELLSSV